MKKLLALFFLCASAAFAQTSQNGRIMEGALATRPTVCSNSDVFIANDSDPPLNFQCGSSNNWLSFGGGGGGSTNPGGFNTMVQYNCGGIFCGDANLEWDFTNKNLNIQGNIDAKGPRPYVDVVAFGADPTFTNDSTAAIQAAINFVCTTGSAGDLFFPPGSYKITRTTSAAPQFSIPTSCSRLSFVGGNGSTFSQGQFAAPPQAVLLTANCSGTGTGPMFLLENGSQPGATQGGQSTTFTNMRLVGCGMAMWVYSATNITFNNMGFRNTGPAGGDTVPLKFTNTFFDYVNGGAVEGFNNSVATVLMTGETALGTESPVVGIVTFRNTIFSGSILYDQRVAGGQGGNLTFDSVQAEIGGSSVPFFVTQCEAGCNAFGPLNISYSGVSDNNSGTPLVQLRGFVRYVDVTVLDTNGSATGSPVINSDQPLFDCFVAGGAFASRTVVTPTGTAQGGCVSQNENGLEFVSGAGALSNTNPLYRTDFLTQSGFFGGNQGPAIRMAVQGDTQSRLMLDPGAGLVFGPGGTSVDTLDAQINRNGAGSIGFSLATAGVFPGSAQYTFNTTGLGINATSPAYALDVNGTVRHQNYTDFTEIAAPANPSAGTERVWADSSTHLFTCKTSSGASCISGGGGGGSFQVNGVGLISSTTVNFQNSAAFNGLTSTFSNLSAGNVQLGLSGTLGIGGGGTGATTASAAFNALAPPTALGGLIVGTGVNTYGNLAPGGANQVLTISGGGTPTWTTPSTVTGSATSGQGTFWNGSGSITGSTKWTYSASSGHSIIQGTDGTDTLYMKRALDLPSSTGNFLHFQNFAANADLAILDTNGNFSIAQQLTTGTGATTHFLKIPEGTTSGGATGFDVLSADSTSHTMQLSNNNQAFASFALFSSTTPTGHGVLLANASIFPFVNVTGAGTVGQCFISNGPNNDPTFQGCVGTVQLSSVLAALATNTINNGDFAQKWNWQKTTNSTNAFELSENVASTATSASLFAVDTIASSTLFPVTITAGGTANGVQMSTAGTLSAIGTGNINASQCGGNQCVKTGSNLTTNRIPKATGISNVGDSLLSDNATTLTYTGVGGLAMTSANAFILDTEGTAPAGVASSDLLWADSTAHTWKFLSNNGSAQTVAATQTCTNQVLVLTDAAATASNCKTITSAYVDTSIAKTGTDINTSNQVTATHIAGATNGVLQMANATGNMVNSSWSDNGTFLFPSEEIDMKAQPMTVEVGNDTVTGTTIHLLAKLTSTGAIKIATTDTGIPVFIVEAGAGLSGNARLMQPGGVGDCVMDANASNTEGFFVIASTTTAGDCHAQSAQPGAGIYTIGTLTVNSTTSGSTSKVMVLNTFSAQGSTTTCSPNAFPNALTDGATVTWAIASAVCSNATLTFTVHSGSRTLNLTGLVNGGSYVLKLVQDATGGESLTGGTGCTWKQKGGGGSTFTLTNSANAIDILAFTYDGTNCLANLGLNYN